MSDQLAQIQESIMRGDYGEARRLALSMLDGQLDNETRARVIHNLALAIHREGNNLLAFDILTESAHLFENAPRLVRANYENECGNVLYGLGRIDDALAHYRAALEGYEKEGRRERQAGVLNNIALVLKDAGRIREAFQYINAARRILESVSDSYVAAEVLDSYSIIIAAQAEGRGENHNERPVHPRDAASEPQSTRAP